MITFPSTSWGQHCVQNDVHRLTHPAGKLEYTRDALWCSYPHKKIDESCCVCVCQSFRRPEAQHGACRHDGAVPERVGAEQGEEHKPTQVAHSVSFCVSTGESLTKRFLLRGRLSRSRSVEESTARIG